MNVASSTSIGKGYLLTALAVAVLLFASSGTAWAQSTLNVGLSMRASPGTTLEEGASMDPSTPGRITLTITRSGADTYDMDQSASGPGNDRTAIFVAGESHVRLKATCNGEGFTGSPADSDCNFEVAVKSGAEAATFGAELGDAGTALTFRDVDGDGAVDKTIELYVSHDTDDGDWDEEEIVLTLELAKASVQVTTDGDARTVPLRASPRKLTLRIADDERQPTFKFDRPNIQLAKGNTQTLTALVGLDVGGRVDLRMDDDDIRDTLNARIEARDDVLLSVSPPDAVGTLIEFVNDDGMRITLPAASGGGYNIGKIGRGTSDSVVGAVGAADTGAADGIKLNIKAIDVSGFRDEQITLTLMDGRTGAQMKADGGGIDPADPATVTLLSGEETPTVTFSTESVTMNEGDTETVHLLADGEQGDQVGAVAVSVSGNATIVLEQGGSPISGGVVQFGDSANAELTIRALEDLTLEDGEEKMATVTITDASGANIGDPRTLTVTVVGSTAVPVLPLVGQLLLGLLLTAGGTRLYRRRQR